MARSDYTAAGQALQQQHDNGPTAIVMQHKTFLDARLRRLGEWVTGGVRPEALVRFALLDLQQNDKLRACTQDSIYLALLACAVTGLEPGALKGEAYLVPFSGKAQFMAGWKGLVKMARRSREVKGLVANVVFAHDDLDIDLGTANAIRHKPLLTGGRGDIIGAYAIATMSGGHREIEWMDREDIDAVRKVADQRAASKVWEQWFDQMARKSVIRRLAKRLPLGEDYTVSSAIEDAQDIGRGASDVLDLVTDGAATKAEAGAARSAEMREQVNGKPDADEEAQIMADEAKQARKS